MRLQSGASVFVVLVLSGCGGDGGDGRPADTTSAPASTATTTTTSATAPTTTTHGPSSSTAPPVVVRCGTVGFTPATEDAAGDITASGASCAEARAFVEMAGRQTSSGGPQEVDVGGYHCERTRTEQEPLPQAFYRCTKGSTTITFVRS